MTKPPSIHSADIVSVQMPVAEYLVTLDIASRFGVKLRDFAYIAVLAHTPACVASQLADPLPATPAVVHLFCQAGQRAAIAEAAHSVGMACDEYVRLALLATVRDLTTYEAVQS